MTFYHFRDTQSAQVQATGVWLHVGGHLLGWARPDYRERGVHRPLWFGLTLWAPIGDCGMRDAFGLRLGRLRVTYTTKGETCPGHHRWDDRGLRVRVLPKRRRASA